MVPAEDLNVHIGTKQRGISKCLQDIVTEVPGLASVLIENVQGLWFFAAKFE